MSGNRTSHKAHESDRRVERTHGALIGALLELIDEKGYEKTTVQDILDRADVGRSTFYAHFANKDDLLIGAMTLFQLGLGDAKQRPDGALPLPSTTHIFQHVGEHHWLYRSLVESGTIAMVLRIAQDDMETSLERMFAKLEEDGRELSDSPEILARFLSGSFFSLMLRWLDSGMEESPEEMDARFRRLASFGLSGR